MTPLLMPASCLGPFVVSPHLIADLTALCSGGFAFPDRVNLSPGDAAGRDAPGVALFPPFPRIVKLPSSSPCGGVVRVGRITESTEGTSDGRKAHRRRVPRTHGETKTCHRCCLRGADAGRGRRRSARRLGWQFPTTSLWRSCRLLLFLLVALALGGGKASAYDVAAGEIHTCVIDDHGVTCWGYNGSGQSTVPADLIHPTAIAAGQYHTCAIDDNGVTCWGDDEYGQSTVPADLIHPTAIAAGGVHTCAIDDNGVTCWGDDFYGQSTVPAGLIHPTTIAVGGHHTCAIDDNGVTCWGWDGWGQSTVPAGLVNPIAISAGPAYTCVIDDHGVTCWGLESLWGIDGSRGPPQPHYHRIGPLSHMRDRRQWRDLLGGQLGWSIDGSRGPRPSHRHRSGRGAHLRDRRQRRDLLGMERAMVNRRFPLAWSTPPRSHWAAITPARSTTTA